jgi:Armadillo/beta-catenin-like repeat
VFVTLSPPLTESHRDCINGFRNYSPAVHAVKAILEGDEDPQKQSILQYRPLPALWELLTSGDAEFASCACGAITTILSMGRVQVKAVIRHRIIPSLVGLLAVEAEMIYENALKAIHAAVTNGTPDQIRVVVRAGCIGPLCDFLRRDVDEDTVSLALEALGHILGSGQGRSGIKEAGGLASLLQLRLLGNHPRIRAVASAILQTYFGDEEE